jgi:hypothetical protein
LILLIQNSFPDKPVASAFGSSQTKKPEQGLHRAIRLFIEQSYGAMLTGNVASISISLLGASAAVLRAGAV